jgi:DNA modification methylase
MKEMPDDSVDLLVTDPPYQLSSITKRFGKEGSAPAKYGKDGAFQRASRGFMGKTWDVLPPVETWKECLRVMKSGAFAFIMTTPRQDSLCQILNDLTQAGFVTGFSSLYWNFASGFPKAMNISLQIDKQECRKQLKEKLGREPTKEEFVEAWKGFRKVIGTKQHSTNFDVALKNKVGYLADEANKNNKACFGYGEEKITNSTTEKAKEFEGSFGGFQPKPAVEIILVCMKPLSEKTYIEQALKNGKGVMWLNEGRIPYESEDSIGERIFKEGNKTNSGFAGDNKSGKWENRTTPRPDFKENSQGRFPANILVSDDVLNDGKEHTTGEMHGIFAGVGRDRIYGHFNKCRSDVSKDSGSFSRYFSLDNWWANKLKELPEEVQRTFPFLIVEKASKGEKNEGCGGLETKELFTKGHGNQETDDVTQRFRTMTKNVHPTCKPIKLMSYLITLGSRPNDIILDPFAGSGTTCMAANILNRKFIGIEIMPEYIEIAKKRLNFLPKKITDFVCDRIMK